MSSRLATAASATAAAALTLGWFAAAGSAGPLASALWSEARAETRVQRSPPPSWVKRGWDVVFADCSGLGAGRWRGSARVYRNFFCEISVVRESSDCPWSGTYVCVAAFEASTRERTLHVIDSNRYALYRM